LGILVNGPLYNLRINFLKVLENAAYMFRSVIFLACIKEKEYTKDAKKTYDAFKQIKELQDEIHCSYLRQLGQPCMETIYPPFSYSNSILEVLKNAPSTQAIKEQATVVIAKIYTVGYYVDIARKVFTVISIVMLIADAVRYLRSYYSDSAFDNMYIGRTTRRHWKKRGYYMNADECRKYPLQGWDELEGLRRWEINKL